ncbi:hypothetical protein D3C81_2085830 [compost metagenome]
MLAAITHEIKCGRYETVCTKRLKNPCLASFSISANMIGAGNPNSSVSKLVASVFRMIR